ncbi:MAG: Crp/Fnr family transcriptional regulator [Synechococcales bacterium]|nr:Crp/Fnr family transcriptional regulator [Synechococcales bacterium]
MRNEPTGFAPRSRPGKSLTFERSPHASQPEPIVPESAVDLSAYIQPSIHQQLASKERLYSQGDPAKAVYQLDRGRVRLIRYTLDGKIVTFRVVRPGETFAEADLYFDCHQCHAICDMPSEVRGYATAVVLEALERFPELARALLRQTCQMIGGLKDRVELLTVRSASDRILQYLRYLLEESTESGQTLTFDRPLKDIAGDLGLSPEVLYRTLTRMEQEGIIRRHKRRITLLKG